MIEHAYVRLKVALVLIIFLVRLYNKIYSNRGAWGEVEIGEEVSIIRSDYIFGRYNQNQWFRAKY